MPDLSKLRFPVLEISAFVDATTVAVTGHRVNMLAVGDEIVVLGIGVTMVPNTNLPLIAPKRELEVTFAAGLYALAQAPLQQRTEPLFPALDLNKTVQYRPKLTNKETSYLGDPGKAELGLGDVVVRSQDVGQFVEFYARDSELVRAALAASREK